MKFNDIHSLLIILTVLSLFCTVHCHPSTSFTRPPFHNFLKSLGHNYVRLGLGYTLPQSHIRQQANIDMEDVFQAMIQVLNVKMSAVSEVFQSNGITKDLNIVAPTNKVEVSYDSGVSAELGNVLTPTLVQNQPKVAWPIEDGAFYTLLLTDPDAPSREDPKWGEWRHWLVTNVPGNDIDAGEVQVEYIGSGPPEDTGLHRYIILVFKQPGRINYTDPKLGLSAKDRNNTKAMDLVTKYNLGNPVAGNFYQAEFDDYVPKLYATLTG